MDSSELGKATVVPVHLNEAVFTGAYDSAALAQPAPGLQNTSNLTQPGLRNAQGDPVLNGDPNQKPPEYPGGIGPDKEILGKIMRQDPYTDVMWQLFLDTYNSRSNENVLPASLTLHEIDPQVKDQITSWKLMGDSAIYAHQPALGGRDLKPIADTAAGSAKNPGHLYAVGTNKDGLPVDVIEYYRDNSSGRINYYRQFVFNYTNTASGHTIDVQNFMASNQTQIFGPGRTIGGIPNTLLGVTRYYEDQSSNCRRVEQYSGWNLNAPQLAVNFYPDRITQFKQNASGQITPQEFSGSQAKMQINGLGPQFYFFDLLGP